ncbi:MAG: hypothetical protein H0T73_22535 [Ardenticatenales bacterium]|nr:hypothetical protein [Ardenticatenales bacterium]
MGTVVHCFEPAYLYEFFPSHFEEFSFDEFHTTAFAKQTPLTTFCDPDDNGQIGVLTRKDGSIQEVIAYCTEEPRAHFFGTQCSPTVPPSVEFRDFLPEEVTLTISWGDQSKTVTTRPTYQRHYPNGPQCDEGCQSAWIEIELP